MSELSICFVGAEDTWLNPVCANGLLIHTMFYVRDMMNLRDVCCTDRLNVCHEPLWRISRHPATFTEITDKCCEATIIVVVAVPFYPQCSSNDK